MHRKPKNRSLGWWSFLRRMCTQHRIDILHWLRDRHQYDGDDVDKHLVQCCFMRLVQVWRRVNCFIIFMNMPYILRSLRSFFKTSNRVYVDFIPGGPGSYGRVLGQSQNETRPYSRSPAYGGPLGQVCATPFERFQMRSTPPQNVSNV